MVPLARRRRHRARGQIKELQSIALFPDLSYKARRRVGITSDWNAPEWVSVLGAGADQVERKLASFPRDVDACPLVCTASHFRHGRRAVHQRTPAHIFTSQ